MMIDVDKLRIQMARKAWNQTELAATSGINSRTLVRIFSGKPTTTKVVGKLAQALECDVTEIL